jgi:hypothetical protein
MANISIWRGYRSFVTGYSDYKTISFVGSEIGSFRFTDADGDVQYRVFRNDNDEIIIFFLERRGYDATAEVYEYPTLEAASKDYAFILKKAGVF